ncbi:hypothetical protein RhiirA1_536269 [Rhizophagus irregularis]|uniref:Uncharacterized protein n=2 Tax=Rhizophagus irregularis TaxID=588596 RepID=A0A2I1E358_9GLOM|nr:hypothetical protein RhiirA1_536269 [Rhizophagus irregularis]PKY16558.1 hypothetical protein RhiirB3_428997 [Rhizophagus irregularis]CAB4477637.1 unnamed protein product [Rhizophagus irregularis]CAB5368092.1 unnamed protein product [Rhizophagus irregularis]
MKFIMKIFPTFLSIAFIAFIILISPVVTFQTVKSVNNADQDDEILKSIGKCVIANAITSTLLEIGFISHTIVCLVTEFIEFLIFGEGGDFISGVVKEIICSILFELIVHRLLGINFGAFRGFIVRIIRRLLH